MHSYLWSILEAALVEDAPYHTINGAKTNIFQPTLSQGTAWAHLPVCLELIGDTVQQVPYTASLCPLFGLSLCTPHCSLEKLVKLEIVKESKPL
eukprot:1159715-Pelagomonas_calceolata.AAC.7